MHACVCECVAKPVAVELRCHATAFILVIGKAQFRRAMLSCDSSCLLSLLMRLYTAVNNKVLFSVLIFVGGGISHLEYRYPYS